MKKIKYTLVNGLIIIVLLAIITNQTLWLNNMHDLYQRELKMYANQAVQQAVLMEITERTENLGGCRVFSNNITNPNDTSRFFTKNVVTEDSTYTFILDKNDPNTMSKIIQFLLKDDLPIDLDKLNKIFKTKLAQSYDVRNTYFDYINLINGKLISSNNLTNRKTSKFIRTDTISLDILSSLGVIGYLESPSGVILDKMKYQLILSVFLMLIAVISLFYISRSFILQWRTEKMRQDSVNAMAHEFKRPISSAIAMAAVIPFYLKKEENNKVMNYAQDIKNELNKLTHYAKRIQQISNNKKGDIILEKTDIEIIPFLESLKRRYQTEKKKQAITINLFINTSKKELRADLLHFSNVMDNLIENSIKYTTNPFVIIDINVSDISNDLKISVKDNGIGISSSDKKRIFDKFYRVKREETKNKIGFGLGLTYVKSIIEAHRGDITVYSEINKGSEFIIILKG